MAFIYFWDDDPSENDKITISNIFMRSMRRREKYETEDRNAD